MEKRDIINDAKSVNKCAASVAIAKLFDNTPPEEKKEKKENLRVRMITVYFHNKILRSIFIYTDNVFCYITDDFCYHENNAERTGNQQFFSGFLVDLFVPLPVTMILQRH